VGGGGRGGGGGEGRGGGGGGSERTCYENKNFLTVQTGQVGFFTGDPQHSPVRGGS